MGEGGNGREREREEILYVCGSLCVPNYKFNSSPSYFATVVVFFSFFPGRKIAFLFSSLKLPFVILKVPGCLCLCRQLAATLLKIAGGGNRYTLNIKNRQGSTGVNNAWERIPLTLGSGFSGGWAAGHGPTLQGKMKAFFCCCLSFSERAAHKLHFALRLPWVGKDKKK